LPRKATESTIMPVACSAGSSSCGCSMIVPAIHTPVANWARITFTGPVMCEPDRLRCPSTRMPTPPNEGIRQSVTRTVRVRESVSRTGPSRWHPLSTSSCSTVPPRISREPVILAPLIRTAGTAPAPAPRAPSSSFAITSARTVRSGPHVSPSFGALAPGVRVGTGWWLPNSTGLPVGKAFHTLRSASVRRKDRAMSAPVAGHPLQPGHPLGGGRVRGEQPAQTGPAERVGDHHVGGGGEAAVLRQRQPPRAHLDLPQGGGEVQRVTGQPGSGLVRLVFAGTGDRHLDDAGRDRTEQHHE